MCRDFAPEFDPKLINLPSDLVNRCRLLCVRSGDAVSTRFPGVNMTNVYGPADSTVDMSHLQ